MESLPIYIIEAIEEAGFPLPPLRVRKSESKQSQYSEMENGYEQ